MPSAARIRLAATLTATLVAVGCGARDCGGDTESEPAEAAVPAPLGPVLDRTVLPLVDLATGCDVEHRGLLVDFGTAAIDGRVGETLEVAARPPSSERGGATWSTVSTRSLGTTFVAPEATPVVLAASLRAVSAKSVTFVLDGQVLGSAKLKAGEARVVELAPTKLPIDPGEHELELRFTPRSVPDAYVELDWVRVGVPDELPATYGAPTMNDVIAKGLALDRVPHASFSLRAPGLVRCPVRVPPAGRLRMAIGMLGAGEGEIEVGVRVDGRPRASLLRKTVRGGEGAKWEDVDLALDAYADQLVQLELSAPTGSPTGRILFGDPEVVVPTVEPAPVPVARAVVLVVLAGVERQALPGYAEREDPNLEHLAELAARATTFTAHRGPTTVVPAAMATLLSGLPPSVHTLTDLGARLPALVPTLTQTAHESSIDTAMFTAVPHTFRAFGFARGAERFEEISPVSGEGRDPLIDAAAWIRQTHARPEARSFTVVHARGGHPPWSVASKQLESLPPENYSGEISPRRAAQQLGMHRRRGRGLDLSANDRTRIHALHQVALAEQDRALGELLDALADVGIDDEALVVVTSDVSSGIERLFDDAAPLDEQALGLPLWVRFPRGAYAGQRVARPTEVPDVTLTALHALGLPTPRGVAGRDLGAVASGLAIAADRPQIASAGDSWSARWGDEVLSHRNGKRATLCNVLLDPTCSFDRRPLEPFAASALLRALAHLRVSASERPIAREPAQLDDDTLAALEVWGSRVGE